MFRWNPCGCTSKEANAADMCISWTCYYGSRKAWPLQNFNIVSLSRYFWFMVSFIDRKQYLTYRNSTRCAPTLLWHRKFSAPFCANVWTEQEDSLKAAGRLFQMAAANTAKSLATMTVLVRCTNSFMVSADRRCRRPAAAGATVQSSARYDGTRPHKI